MKNAHVTITSSYKNYLTSICILMWVLKDDNRDKKIDRESSKT